MTAIAPMEVKLFPCLTDNYGFLLHDPNSGQTATIDTPDADEIMRQADQAGWTLTHIFNTHHHLDHVGGNQKIKQQKGVTIIGPRAEAARIPGIDQAVGEGDIIKLGEHPIQIMDTPAHTAGHIAYYIRQQNIIFVGDTLFALGCGRLFEGTAAQMWAALEKFSALPGKTKVYCAHEYTLSNGRFAQTIEPKNPELQAYMARARTLRDQDRPTIPTTIAAERSANPFMRAHLDTLALAVDLPGHSPAEILGEIRRRKDAFKG